MKERTLTYAMVGGGPGSFIGSTHRRAIQLDSTAKLVGGCFSKSFEKTQSLGEELGLDPGRLYENVEDMALKEGKRDDGIDFVVIATPNFSHYKECKAFLEAGIHVVCDKPMTVEVWEGEELERLAKEKHLLFGVTYSYAGHVTVNHARELIARGLIGKIRMISAEYPQAWLADGEIRSWRMNKEIAGRSSCMGDIGTHIENTVFRMTGLKINRLLAKLDKLVDGHDLDDNGVVMVEYDNGASGVYWASQIAIGEINDLKVRVYGSEGSVSWSQENCEELKVADKDGVTTIHRRGDKNISTNASKYQRIPAGHNEGFIEALANIYVNFADCLRKKENGVLKETDIEFPTVTEGLRGVKFVHGCVDSWEGGGVWVKI